MDDHKKAMEEVKAKVDEQVKSARKDKGLIIVLTGNGKGKSSSGFGMVLRCLGHGMKVGVVQFIKGQWKTGEQQFFNADERVDYFQMGAGFTWDTQDKQADIERCERCWSEAKRMLADPSYDFVMIDELNVVLHFGYLDTAEVVSGLKSKVKDTHVVITGRDAPQELLDIADTVSVIESPKHAFDAGIRAQKGVEF